ncbi:MAG: M24 family metallopeptidase [Candidatus Chisholmbacteria bacterium]|nr:M24 family metallopeptidase [Candidatus Chisholmbacteria bacterium]
MTPTNDQQREAMREGGKMLGRILNQVVASAKPGVSLHELDSLADTLLTQTGGEPGFKRVPGYRWATCINVNAGVVHGIPHPHLTLKQGDLVSLDTGLFYQGFHTDTSTTVVVGKPSQEQQHFLDTGKRALSQGIAQAKPGKRIGHISQAMQKIIEAARFNCARHLTGHGIGQNLHQSPMIPCLLHGKLQVGLSPQKMVAPPDYSSTLF